MGDQTNKYIDLYANMWNCKSMKWALLSNIASPYDMFPQWYATISTNMIDNLNEHDDICLLCEFFGGFYIHKNSFLLSAVGWHRWADWRW